MKVEKLDHYGRGIIHIDNKICFVKNALENELVDIEIIKNKKKYIEAKAITIKNKSKNRVNAKCKYYHVCGGCHLMHMDDDLQNEFKQKKINEILRKFSNYDGEIKNLESDKKLNYRNKVILHVKNKKLGFYKEGSNELIEIEECLLLNNQINELIKILKEYIKVENNINKITIKIGNQTREVMLIIEGDVKEYKSLLDKVDVLIINDKIVTDKKYIKSYIGNKIYQIGKDSFFQVNEFMTKKLYDEVLKNIKECKSKNVLDLYCGTGTIGIYISDYVDKVIGIEVVKDAINDAKINKELNKVENIKFILGKVEDKINDIDSNFDTIIVDPPRSGLHKNVVEVIKKIKPKNIIYVSCDPITLARDLNLLKDDYNTNYVKPFDMFPNTHHVECVSVLYLKK